MQYALYHFENCPFCVRVRQAMEAMNVSMELVDVRKHPEKREEMYQNTGKTMVPCLKMSQNDETSWLHESGDIIDYIKQNIA